MPIDEYDLTNSYTPIEAADVLGVNIRTLWRIIAAGDLRTIRIGSGRGRARIPHRAVLEYINQRATKPAPPEPLPLRRSPRGKP